MNLLPLVPKSFDLASSFFRFKARVEGSFVPSSGKARNYKINVVNTGGAAFTVQSIAYCVFDIVENKDLPRFQVYSSSTDSPKSVAPGSAQSFEIAIENPKHLNHPISQVFVTSHHRKEFRGNVRDPASERLLLVSQFLFACIANRIKALADLSLDRWTFTLAVKGEGAYPNYKDAAVADLGQLGESTRWWFPLGAINYFESERRKEVADSLVECFPRIFILMERTASDGHNRTWLGFSSKFVTYCQDSCDLYALPDWLSGGTVPPQIAQNFLKFLARE